LICFTQLAPFYHAQTHKEKKLKMFSIKELVESNCLKSVPSNYFCLKNPEDSILYYEADNIPTIDFSQLTSSNLNERSKGIQQLGNACRDWGFFKV